MNAGAATGCHQLPERSFFFRQYQFPVCARCCGVLVGEILSVAALIKHKNVKSELCILAAETMFFDWFIQYKGVLESNNTRRFISGILGGFGCWTIEFDIIKRVIRINKS